MFFVTATALLIIAGIAIGRWRERRWMDRKLEDWFGQRLTSEQRARLRLLYFGRG